MLYRTIDENRICITQPTHAWVSGQLAQAWGNGAIARNQKLIATWDALSLAICMGVTKESQFEQVPAATGEVTLVLAPIHNDPTRLQLKPWCFQTEEVTVVFEGRVLKEQFQDEQVMRDRLTIAPWVTLTATLYPANAVR